MFLGPHYCLVTTPKQFKRELKRLNIKGDLDYTMSPSANATCYEFESNGKTSFIVTLKGWKGQDPIEIASLLVHEATHIKQHVMRIIGEKNPSNEFEAYVMQNIAGNLMQAFKDQTA
jgi:hypothetical protein